MTIKERTPMQDYIEPLMVFGGLLLALVVYMLMSGSITFEQPAPSSPATTPEPTVIPTIEIITPEPTPAALPTLADNYVDPFAPGPRSEGQWYKFYRTDVQGLKDMEIGIVSYRHAFLDRYTWWNPSTGNYYSQKPNPGNRFFVVWVHEEEFGTDQSQDSTFWPLDDSKFAIQIKDQIYPSAINNSYLPVIRIKEFDELTNYYDTVTAPPFGYYVRYTGTNPESGGFRAEKIAPIRMGKENGIDGYIIYEVPKESQLMDMQLVGSFGTFGDAQWKY